ncbi:helix-turn-helix domain-containing protein [Pseudoduganella sp.]|uniref:helix-turn-helix domain-containing protein n=1 Tax=Pseudoduganella sp. TaxID=1880898 RepID=UPI0035AEC585
MTTDTKSAHITPVGGNVFVDLGFDPSEAAALQANSNRIIAGKIAIKEQLMTELAQWVVTNKLRQADAARLLGITRPRVSDVINKKTPNFTIDALVDMLSRIGKRVTFTVA